MANPNRTKRPPGVIPTPTKPEEILRELYRGQRRVETKVGRIMERLGLDSRGDPIKPPVEPGN